MPPGCNKGKPQVVNAKTPLPPGINMRLSGLIIWTATPEQSLLSLLMILMSLPTYLNFAPIVIGFRHNGGPIS